MTRLWEYLDANEWQECAGIRRARKGDWTYRWLCGAGSGVPAGMAFLFWTFGERGKTLPLEVETFVIQGETRCLEIAAGLDEGQHPDSPFDRRTGKKIGWL